jgi:tetratricopeptide (TPR) repeat protein
MAIQRDKIIASAEKLVAKGKIEPAIKEYERLLDDNPNDVNTLNRIGDLWVRINRNDEAVKVFAKIADHYSKDGFFLKAIAIYKKINKLDPSKLDIYAKLADLYAKQGLAMEAKSQYQVLADYYLKHGDPGNALVIYRKISELDPNSINVHVKLADLYSQNNQKPEALKEYDRVGRMLLKRSMLDEAVQVFKKALKIDSSNVELVESLVTALLEAKDYENALQIVQTSIETSGDDARLLAINGRILLAKGDLAGARAALERALSRDANAAGVRESLSDLYVRVGNADGALEMLAPLVEKAVGRGERGVAVEMLNRILRVDSSHTPTLERLVALYARLNEETNILSSMSSLAEAHVAKGQYEKAAEVLDKLIQREPQNAQHRTKLQFVRSQMGGVDTMPARPQASVPVAPLSMEIEEPVPTFDSFDDEPSLSLDLDTSEPIEINLDHDFAAPSPDRAPPPPQPPPPLPRLQPAVEQFADRLEQDEEEENLDFITEHLTEADVFAKYGLAEKATEHLRAIIERAPKHLVAHLKLYRLLLDEGDVDAARAAANQYLHVLREKGDTAAADDVRDEFAGRGYPLDSSPPKPAVRAPVVAPPSPAPARPAPPPPAPAPVAAPPPAAAPDDEFADEMSFDIESAVADFELTASAPPVPEPGFSFDSPATSLSFEEPISLLEPKPESALTFESPIDEGGFSFDSPAGSSGAQPVSEQPVFEDELPSFSSAPSAEELREVDFYIEQELFDEAREKMDALSSRFPDNSSIIERRARLAAAARPAQPEVRDRGVVAAPAVLSRDEIESELLSALPDDDDDFFAPPPPVQPAAPPPPPVAAAAAEENLFADEDDFFDLAAELESELEEEENVSLSEEEQSLEEIFKEFKKGVEQQLDSEDYDTHYNLGIAYKEMGLIDEAIGEFQLASKDPKRSVECSSMLGLCFLEKGMPQLAIKWYRKGLEMTEITADEHVGLLYDLGSAYMEVGDTDSAQKAFLEVYGLNPSYRDIVTRIKQLEDASK